MSPLLRATRYVSTVDLIDVDDLKERGIRLVLIDRDNTLVPRDGGQIPPEVSAWLDDLREAGIEVCMVSNNFHTKAVEASAAKLGISCVHHAMKPSPIAVKVALAKHGVPREHAIMVGDQIFTDVLSGNLAGLGTILVRPQSEADLQYTLLLRKLERVLLKGVPFEGE